ncbi:unnamed protein product [Caenorhabditis bovis]|uniref:Uncharacterized protein n=1 Tax=Caenorhabditis bovis TaxID=2654633 RepID=A0A8S1FB08_9PELO|nr:unnamed protein product [Caenorhabditis bovis]
MSRLICLLLTIGCCVAQVTDKQTISMNPNQGQIKLNIVFQTPKDQSPVVGSNNIGCSSGKCQLDPVITSATPIPVPITTTPYPVIVKTIPAVQKQQPQPIYKVIRMPSSNRCFSPPCYPSYSAPRVVVVPSASPCGNQPCRQFFYNQPRRIFVARNGNFNNNNNNNAMAVPDAIFKDGRSFRAPIRVPTKYIDGNPIFDIGK